MSVHLFQFFLEYRTIVLNLTKLSFCDIIIEGQLYQNLRFLR